MNDEDQVGTPIQESAPRWFLVGCVVAVLFAVLAAVGLLALT